MFDDVERQLSRIWRSLAAAIERAAREFAPDASRRVPRTPRAGPVATRLPSPHVRRPVSHPLLLPRRLHGRTPGSGAQRGAAAHTPAGAERLADVLRGRLLDLQTALRRLQQRLGNIVEGRQ